MRVSAAAADSAVDPCAEWIDGQRLGVGTANGARTGT